MRTLFVLTLFASLACSKPPPPPEPKIPDVAPAEEKARPDTRVTSEDRACKTDAECTLTVRAADTRGCWQARLRADGTEVRREVGEPGEAGRAHCVLEGPASGLYAFLWNRSDSDKAGITVGGDPSVLDSWGSSVRVQW